jgi:hypothetical protein
MDAARPTSGAKEGSMRRIRMLAASLFVSAALTTTVFVAPVGAYGGGADHDMWQVGISFNCNNPDFCGGGGNGFWAWAEFDRSADGNTTWGDLEGSFCFHLVPAGGDAGAGHISVEIESWTIEPGTAGPQTFFVWGEEIDSFRGQSQKIDLAHADSMIPAVPGHYTASDVFGFDPPPGVAVEIQVAFRPAK